MSTILSYAAVASLVLLLIIILPCIVRTLQQSTQKLVTELHLAVLKNEKGGHFFFIVKTFLALSRGDFQVHCIQGWVDFEEQVEVSS